MRLRPVKHASETIEQHPEHITLVDRDDKVELDNVFSSSRPLVVEIGAGKGQFCHTLAAMNPNLNVLAIEMFDSVIIRALEKQLDDPKENLHLVRMDAQKLSECLKPGSVDAIYLNFSDPWPKARHEKRRLTHPRFLSMYRELLKPGGTLSLKTDNRGLFEYSLMTLNQAGVELSDVSLNLHADDPDDNIMTEFEARYGEDGPIYKLIATFKEENA